MTDWGTLLLAAFAAVGLIALAWWLFYETEGVYLGRGMVIWLYDLYANRYDHIKQFSDVFDRAYLAEPIMDMIAPHQSPLVLDIATGTGRLPLTLLNDAQFQGRIVGIDLSGRMLNNAAQKLNGFDRVTFIRVPAETLPFENDTFDIVTCLEALEFMENPQAVVREAIRVLRPGGLLLTTNRVSIRLMPGKTWKSEQFAELLIDMGLEAVEIDFWQVDYQRVWALKTGESLPTGARPLAEILRCPGDLSKPMIAGEGEWICSDCDLRAPVAANGVIDLAITLKTS
jgi:ubiquinone/menaquinone biosynthesis C-methylase UbiE